MKQRNADVGRRKGVITQLANHSRPAAAGDTGAVIILATLPPALPNQVLMEYPL
jgi:hypothetical protein